MPAVRPATSLPSLPVLEVSRFEVSSILPIGIGKDNSTIYGAGGFSSKTLYQSTDACTTWSVVKVFGDAVRGFREGDDGEALVITETLSSNPGYVLRSSGFAASHTAATWTEVLRTVGGQFRAFWSGGHPWAFGDDQILAGSSAVGICGEYGPQSTTDPTVDNTKATRVWVTLDAGATWTLRLDLLTAYTGRNTHIHATAYDPFSDRMWVTYGDSPVVGPESMFLLFSDDRGLNWQHFPLPLGLAGKSTLQSTSIAVIESGLLLGSDNAPGYLLIRRTGYRQYAEPVELAVVAGRSGSQMLANGMHRNRRQPTAPILMCHQTQNTTASGGIMMVIPDSLSLTEIWRTRSGGVQRAYGPLPGGEIVANVNGGKILVGKLVNPPSGLQDRRATLTGDGTTTVFTVAHRLATPPGQVKGYSLTGGGAFTITSDATNFTINFPVAPAAGAVLDLVLRAGGASSFISDFLTPLNFLPFSVFRQNVTTAPVDPDSGIMVTELLRQIAIYGNVAANLTQYNTPVITVSASCPRQTVNFYDDQNKGYVPSQLYIPSSGAHFVDVPLPPELVPPVGRDASVETYQPSTDKAYSFWRFAWDRVMTAGKKFSIGGGPLQIATEGQILPGPSAVWGGRIDNVSTSDGIYPNGTGVSASGLFVPEGQMLVREAARGFADHAMTIQLYKPKASAFSYPAKRTDGWGNGPEFIREGQRLRLKASADLSALHPLARIYGEAAKTWGLIVTDKTGAVSAAFEDTQMFRTANGYNPWDEYVAGTATYNIFKNFPWSQMEVIVSDWGKPFSSQTISGAAGLARSPGFGSSGGAVQAFYPDATTTGIPVGRPALTTITGNYYMDTAGQILEDKLVLGRIIIRAANCVVRYCKVRGNANETANKALIDTGSAACANALVERCEVDPQAPSVWLNAVQGGNVTVRRCNLHDTVDYVAVTGPNVRLEQNWGHDFAYFTPDPNHTDDNQTHNDAVQFHPGGTGAVLVGNRWTAKYGTRGSHQPALAGTTPSGASNVSAACYMFGGNLGTNAVVNLDSRGDIFEGAYTAVNGGGPVGLNIGKIWGATFENGMARTIDVSSDTVLDAGEGTSNAPRYQNGTLATVRRNQ